MGQATFGDTIDAVYRAAADPQSWSAALEQIADHVGGSGAILVHNDFARGTGLIVNGRLRDDLGELYVREYCGNPLVLAIAKHGRIGRPDLVSSLPGKDTFKRTAFHADILEPQRIVDQIAMPHQAFSKRGSRSGGFAVMLTHRHTDRARAAIERMGRLAPHLSRALDLSLEVAQHRDEARRLDTLLDALPTAAMLLDRTGRIIRANMSAERIIGTDDGIGTRSGMSLTGSLPDEDRRLRHAISRALTFRTDDDDGFEQALSVNRPSGLPPLLVILTPLLPTPFAFWEIAEHGARLLVQIVDPISRLDDRTDPLQEAYGLTIAEARVAGLIGSGLSTPQAARALGLSTATVRTHLTHCFDKTGVRSQVSLARLVTAIGRRAPGR